MPVVIRHGDADDLLPVWHSRWLVAALRKQDTPVRYDEIAGGGHDSPTVDTPWREYLDFVLGDLDFLLHCLVFAVGLDLHQLVLELRQPALLLRQVLLDLAPARLVGGEALTLAIEPGLRGSQSGVEFLLPHRFAGNRATCLFGRVLESLKANDVFEVRMHIGSGGPTRIRTWDRPVMSRRL